MASDEATKAVEDWLDRFETLMPSDGKLTKEILEAVGELPVVTGPLSGRAPERIVSAISNARARAKIGGSLSAKRRSVERFADAASWRELDPETADANVAAGQYWLQVQSWIDRAY